MVLDMLLLYTCIMHVHYSFIYILTRSVSDDSGFAHPNIRCFIILIRCSMRPRSWSFSLSYSGILIYFYSCCYLFDSLYIRLSCHSISYSYVIMCGQLHVILQWS